MKKITLTFVLLLVFLSFANAQNQGGGLKDKFFQSLGFAYFTDFDKTPLRDWTAANESGKYYGYSWTIVTAVYAPRINLYEPTQNLSFSIYAPIALGFNAFSISSSATTTKPNPQSSSSSFGIDNSYGYFKFALPVYLQMNFGNIATMATDMEKGFTAGIGFEYQINPIYMSTDSRTISKSTFLMPSMNIGYRYWNKNNNASEVNLKVGMGSSSSAVDIYGKTITGTPLSIMLSFHKFLNY